MVRIWLPYGLKYEYSSKTFDSSLGYQDIEIVKGGDIETIIVYLVKGDSTSAHLQYNRLCGMGLSFKQVKYYGNQSLSWIWEGDTVDDAYINNNYLSSIILLIS